MREPGPRRPTEDARLTEYLTPTQFDASVGVGDWRVISDGACTRFQAALGAGGHLVRDRAPMWWTVADSAGNEVDIATTRNRD